MGRQEDSRREFLKKGAAGIAAMTVLPGAVRAAQEAAEPPAEKPAQKAPQRKVIHRTLGKTGIKLPVVSMGARFDTPEQIRAALDNGIVHIDTANSYGNGRHEEAIGEAIKGRPRDSFVIGTKVYMNFDHKTGLFPEDATAEPFLEKFETSMGRLGLDYVDILYLHDVVKGEAASFEPYLAAMKKLKEAGRTRFIGVSTHTNEPEVINAVVESKAHDVVLTAYNFMQPHLPELEQAIERAGKAGLGMVAMKTQAGVFWDKERTQQINMKAALKWVLNNPHMHTTIPGFANFEEMEVALSVMEGLELTPEERKDLKLDETEKQAGLFCPQCGDCLSQCDRDLDIPTLMRSFMYAHGYRDLAKAKNAVRNIDLSRIPCDGCDVCKVTACRMGFDVRSKVRDIARIRQVPDDFIA
jgi:aryl-alcohol dehydrogenase-like predicted oxidoreductase